MSDKPSDAWYLAPIFMGVIGSTVMWFVLKDEDHPDSPKMIKKGWIIGIVFTLLCLVWIIPFVVMGSIMGSMMGSDMMQNEQFMQQMGKMMQEEMMERGMMQQMNP